MILRISHQQECFLENFTGHQKKNVFTYKHGTVTNANYYIFVFISYLNLIIIAGK